MKLQPEVEAGVLAVLASVLAMHTEDAAGVECVLCARRGIRVDDLFENIPAQNFDIIVANPPYVSVEEMVELDKEFGYEPHSGLAGGETGMDIVIPLLQQAGDYLSDHGILVVEVGYSMPALLQLLPEVPFTWLEFVHGGEGVFLLTAEQLRACQELFDAL